jgi:hypothetical protein
MITLHLDSEDDARVVDAHFDSFHGSLFSRIELSSSDTFREDGSQVCTGGFTLILELHHRNYKRARRGRGRANLVRGVFREVCNVELFLRGYATEWTIHSLSFHRAERKSWEGIAETCFLARLVPNVLAPITGCAKAEMDVFSFKNGSIVEVGRC